MEIDEQQIRQAIYTGVLDGIRENMNPPSHYPHNMTQEQWDAYREFELQKAALQTLEMSYYFNGEHHIGESARNMAFHACEITKAMMEEIKKK